jgi:hypothetical protein
MGTISRIIMGAKSRGLTSFVSHINAGNAGNPATWTVTQGTDAAATADVNAPGGYHSAVSFATSSALVTRATLAGDDVLDDYLGEYRVFMRCEQVGGSNGDVKVLARAMVGGTADGYPIQDVPSGSVALQTHDVGWELVELGTLKLPFSKAVAADATNIDLIFLLKAERLTGAATLKIADIILIPIDEWAAVLDDPVTSTTTGASALRGNTSLDDDGGVLAERTVKYIRAGTTLSLAEPWIRSGRPLMIEPRRQTRIYFILAGYPTTFGTGPLVAPLGMQLMCSLYAHAVYESLRGSD